MILTKTQLSESSSLKLKQAFYGLLLVLLLLMLSGCGLISSKVTQTPDPETAVEIESTDIDVKSNIDVVGISQATSSGNDQSANISLRFLSIQQESKALETKPDSQHGYFWLDGYVKDIQYQNGVVNVVEVESAYDGERYVVSGTASLLEKLAKGRFVYLDGFYDTFSGFTALKYTTASELLENLVQTSVGVLGSSNKAVFGYDIVEQVNKRKQTILLSNEEELKLNSETSFYDAYTKEVMTKNAFWRSLSQGDMIYVYDDQLWLVDQQTADKAVFGTVKQVNEAENEIVLATELWLLKDNQVVSQAAEVLLKVDRKTQVLSSNGQALSSGEASLVPGQQVVVEGTQKNRLLNVERLYVKENKDLPVYVYGTVKKHQNANRIVELTVEWMFGLEPAKTVEVAVNSFTELFEITNKDSTLDSTEFWKLISVSDDIEVEGYMVGNTLQANRLFLGNKEKELQTFSGTVDSINEFETGKIVLRLYSYASDGSTSDSGTTKRQVFQASVSEVFSKDLIDLSLANDVVIQDIHGAESIVVEEFWRRLEPEDQLTVKGYFEDDSFIATSVEFEDQDTTPFVFGEVEAFDAVKQQIMLNGKNQVIVLTKTTSIKDTKLARLSAKTFWTELTTGDSIDIKGLYKDGVFFATEVFLSPNNEELQEDPAKKDSFNLFDWLMN